MNSGRFVFVLEIPPKFESDALAARRPTVQIDVDATAVSQAGIGASYLQNIIAQEASSYLQRNEGSASLPINLVIRTAFNPNRTSEWFLSIMAVINDITMLAVILTGSALIREREHGTVEHLLVMPVRPAEIMIAKIWANGLVIVVAAILSLWFVVPRRAPGAARRIDAVVPCRYGPLPILGRRRSAFCSQPSPARWVSSVCS